MKAEPKLLNASIRFAGGKPMAVLEVELDARDALSLGTSIGGASAQLQPIADLAEQLDKEQAAELAAKPE